MSTSIAPVHVAAAERRLVARLRAAGAVSAVRPVPLDPADRLEALRLSRLQAAGVIRPARPGTFYLDEDAYDAYRAQRRRFIAGVVLLALVGGIAAVALTVTLAR